MSVEKLPLAIDPILAKKIQRLGVYGRYILLMTIISLLVMTTILGLPNFVAHLVETRYEA